MEIENPSSQSTNFGINPKIKKDSKNGFNP